MVSTEMAQVWCSHRGYSGIPYMFYRQRNFQERDRQALEGSQRGQSQGKLMAPQLSLRYVSVSSSGDREELG